MPACLPEKKGTRIEVSLFCCWLLSFVFYVFSCFSFYTTYNTRHSLLLFFID